MKTYIIDISTNAGIYGEIKAKTKKEAIRIAQVEWDILVCFLNHQFKYEFGENLSFTINDGPVKIRVEKDEEENFNESKEA